MVNTRITAGFNSLVGKVQNRPHNILWVLCHVSVLTISYSKFSQNEQNSCMTSIDKLNKSYVRCLCLICFFFSLYVKLKSHHHFGLFSAFLLTSCYNITLIFFHTTLPLLFYLTIHYYILLPLCLDAGIKSQSSKDLGTANSIMWVDKYKPQSVKQIIGQHGDASNVKKLVLFS